MRYLALIGIVICRFSFAQIANSPMSINQSPTAYNFEHQNSSPIQFNQSTKTVCFLLNESHFVGTDISQSCIGFAHQFRKNRITGSLKSIGSPDLSENALNIAYGMQLKENVSVGIGLITSNSSSESINQIGGGYQLFGSYQLSNHAFFNFWHQVNNQSAIQSIGYHVVKNQSLLSANLTFIRKQPILEIAAGLKIREAFTVNAIISNGPYWIGIAGSCKIKQFIFTGKVAYHENQLGFRPSIYIHYVFQEQKSEFDTVRLDVVHKHKSSNRHRSNNESTKRSRIKSYKHHIH